MPDYSTAIMVARLSLKLRKKRVPPMWEQQLAEAVLAMAKDLEAYEAIDAVLEIANRCESCGGQPAGCDCCQAQEIEVRDAQA